MMKQAAIRALYNVFLILCAALVLTPLLWMLSASLMPAGEAASLPSRFLPSRITTAHYAELFQRVHVGRYLLNSTLIASAVTLVSLFFNSAAGYAFARLRFRGRERLFSLLLAGMIIPGQVGMLPLFLLVRELGLVNTPFGVVVPAVASIFGIFLIRQFALSLPLDLIEAARADGAGELRIYWSIALPLCRPILVTLAVFTFLGTWNDFMWPLIVLTDQDNYTLPVALANLLGEHAQDTELMMAGSVLTVAPVLLLFLALQRYYISGITAGGLKE